MTSTREKIIPAQLEQRVYERLSEEIVSGKLLPGDQLVESKLAAEFGVSKTPVREALIRLQRDGLVEIEPYRGARVGEPSAKDMEEISELRLLLESRIAADLARDPNPDVIASLDDSLSRAELALDKADDQGVRDALTAFFDHLANASENTHFKTVLNGLRNKMMLIGNTSATLPGRHKQSITEHRELLNAIRTGDPDKAAEATVEHVRSIERAWLATVAAKEGSGSRTKESPSRSSSREPAGPETRLSAIDPIEARP